MIMMGLDGELGLRLESRGYAQVLLSSLGALPALPFVKIGVH